MNKHMHLCKDCGKPLYQTDWCNEEEDHRIAGRCDECWKRLGTVWMIEHAYAYGVTLTKAYHPDDVSRYSEWYRPFCVLSTGEATNLPNITLDDLPERPSDGEFLGCGNQAWILTEEEKEKYIKLNADRQKIIDDQEAEELRQIEAEERERNKRKRKYKILREYELVLPSGGEAGGTDGYWDADIQSVETSAVTRVVTRNVFDFGYYGYPKRAEGDIDKIFEESQWTKDEVAAIKWATEFSPLPQYMRM